MRIQIRVGLLATLLSCSANVLLAQQSTQATAPLAAAGEQEEIEWTWEVRPPHADTKLPNVLLVGDSITRNYFPEVRKQLAAKANVYLFATSACAGDPRLPDQLREFARMERVEFQIVHFNNGMHGWAYTESEYASGLKAMLAAIRTIAPKAALVWANTTPVKTESDPGPTNARIQARDTAALELFGSLGISIDDQHELMKHHTDLYEDSVHFNSAGAVFQGDQAARIIGGYLPK